MYVYVSTSSPGSSPLSVSEKIQLHVNSWLCDLQLLSHEPVALFDTMKIFNIFGDTWPIVHYQLFRTKGCFLLNLSQIWNLLSSFTQSAFRTRNIGISSLSFVWNALRTSHVLSCSVFLQVYSMEIRKKITWVWNILGCKMTRYRLYFNMSPACGIHKYVYYHELPRREL